MKQISKEKIELLNKGIIESKNLMEFLSVDLATLFANVLPEFHYPELQPKLGITKKYRLISQELQKQFGFKIFDQFLNHKSDIIRNFACYLISEQNFNFNQKLKFMKPLANDSNQGVREWAWMAIRDEFASDLQNSIKLLVPWSMDNSANIRRFASELSRPRGVWCKHINELKQNPEFGIAILEPLCSDSSIYVQLSVGNWLNDAGKDRPEWVINLCQNWRFNSKTKETEKICKRALRNL